MLTDAQHRARKVFWKTRFMIYPLKQNEIARSRPPSMELPLELPLAYPQNLDRVSVP